VDTGAFYDRLENKIELTDGKNGWNFTVILNKLITKDAQLIVYPNPAVDQINIWFNLVGNQSVKIKIFDLFGNVLFILPKRDYLEGENYLNIPLFNFKPGVYMMEFKTDKEVLGRKILIEK
jgi:hypothetical protein